jgi:hypothetical protein
MKPMVPSQFKVLSPFLVLKPQWPGEMAWQVLASAGPVDFATWFGLSFLLDWSREKKEKAFDTGQAQSKKQKKLR